MSLILALFIAENLQEKQIDLSSLDSVKISQEIGKSLMELSA